MCLNVFVKALHCVLVARQIMLTLRLKHKAVSKRKTKGKYFRKCPIALGYVAKQNPQYVEFK